MLLKIKEKKKIKILVKIINIVNYFLKFLFALLIQFGFIFRYMKKIAILSCLCLSLTLTNCATLMGEKAKDDALNAANSKAKTLGLKVGSSCKYIGFIGNNSESNAIKNGNIKMKMFSVNAGGFFKNCTYAYGR